MKIDLKDKIIIRRTKEVKPMWLKPQRELQRELIQGKVEEKVYSALEVSVLILTLENDGLRRFIIWWSYIFIGLCT